MGHIVFATPIRIRAADGSIVWEGSGLVADGPFIYVSAEATNAFDVAEAARLDTATLVLPRMGSSAAGGYSAATEPPEGVYKILRVSAANNVNWVGVTLTPIAAGKSGSVAGPGSIVPVQSLTSGSITSNAVGAQVIGSSTAGRVNAAAAVGAGAATNIQAGGTVLGRVVQIAGTSGPPTDSGSATVLGVLVTQGY